MALRTSIGHLREKSQVTLSPLVVLYTTTLIFSFTSISHETNFAFMTSYLFGDEATQYGLLLFSVFVGMAVGSFVSKHVEEKQLLTAFMLGEVLLTLLSGFSVVIGLWLYTHIEGYVLPMWSIIIVIAILVGLEDAFILRFASYRETNVKNAVSRTMGLSNLGSAAAGLAFGQVLIPLLGGSLNVALFLGIVDGALVIINIAYFRKELKLWWLYLIVTCATLMALSGSYLNSDVINASFTTSLYSDPIVRRWETQYGTIVITRDEQGEHRLFINGALQLATSDEEQYHEMLAHPALALTQERMQHPLNVVIFGGGDGFLARELERYPTVASITVVDLNPTMTGEVAQKPPLVDYNHHSFADPRIHIINKDAFIFARDTQTRYDLVYVDLVDPDTLQAAKLYTDTFYTSIKHFLQPGGVMVTQSTSPWYSGKAYWIINNTLRTTFSQVVPYHWSIPSFGDWGFNLATDVPFDPHMLQIQEEHTTWLTTEGWQAALFFGKTDLLVRDEVYQKKLVNRISNLILVYYYTHDNRWNTLED